MRRSLAIALALAALASPAGAGKRPNLPRNWHWPPSLAMKKLGASCLEDLTQLGVDWKPGPRTRIVATPVIVESMTFGDIKLTPVFRKPPFVLDCYLARALARAAPALHASGIAELRFSTIHQYRHVRLEGKTKKALSRHSLGLAVDVYQLVTRDGQVVVIQDSYEDSSVAHAVEALLRRSELFRTVLTPGNDPVSHYDHFHLEARMKIPAPRLSAREKRRRARRRRRVRRRRRARRARRRRARRRRLRARRRRHH